MGEPEKSLVVQNTTGVPICARRWIATAPFALSPYRPRNRTPLILRSRTRRASVAGSAWSSGMKVSDSAKPVSFMAASNSLIMGRKIGLSSPWIRMAITLVECALRLRALALAT